MPRNPPRAPSIYLSIYLSLSLSLYIYTYIYIYIYVYIGTGRPGAGHGGQASRARRPRGGRPPRRSGGDGAVGDRPPPARQRPTGRAPGRPGARALGRAPGRAPGPERGLAPRAEQDGSQGQGQVRQQDLHEPVQGPQHVEAASARTQRVEAASPGPQHVEGPQGGLQKKRQQSLRAHLHGFHRTEYPVHGDAG